MADTARVHFNPVRSSSSFVSRTVLGNFTLRQAAILAHRLNAAVRYINTHIVRKRCDVVCVSSMYAMIGLPPNVLHMLQWRIARFSTSHEALLAFEEARSVADTAAAAAAAIVLGHLGTYRIVSPT